MVLFDTNAILRYILQDNPTMADEVEHRLHSTKNCKNIYSSCLANVTADKIKVLSK